MLLLAQGGQTGRAVSELSVALSQSPLAFTAPAVPPEVAPITATPTTLVTPAINVTLVCSIVSNPQVSSVVWTSAVEGRAAETIVEASQQSVSGQYGQVTTTSTVVVLARGVEEQVR